MGASYRWTKTVRPSPKRYFAMSIPDVHVGYIVDTPTHSHGCWDLGMQTLAHYRDRLTHLVIHGDFGNWESLSRWAALRAEQAFVEEDVALVNAKLDEIQSLLRPEMEVVFCEGNHEAWAASLEAKYPAIRNQVNLYRRLRFKERGWKWIRENSFYALGDAHFTHGHSLGIKGPADYIRKKHVSVFFGHTHGHEVALVRSLTGEHYSASMGCWASIDPPPPYAKGEHPERWAHGFGLFQVRANGRFQVDFRRILDECWTELPDGTELRADLKAIQKRIDAEARVRDQLREDYRERFYTPGGPVTRPEPIRGTERATRNVRGRIVRGR